MVRFISNSLKPVVHPSVCSTVSSSVRQNHLWAQRALQPSAVPSRGAELSSYIYYTIIKYLHLPFLA